MKDEELRGRFGAASMAEKLRQVIIYPGEDGFWVAECPSLPGCISQGQTRTEAIANVREAIEAYVAALEEDGLDVPEERFDVLVHGRWDVAGVHGSDDLDALSRTGDADVEPAPSFVLVEDTEVGRDLACFVGPVSDGEEDDVALVSLH